MLGLRQMLILQQAGFPFEADNFTLDYWLDLGVLKARLDAKRVFF